MPSSRTISANGIEIFLLEQGEGPLVLFCHGWPELSYSWRHQIPALAAAGFHVADVIEDAVGVDIGGRAGSPKAPHIRRDNMETRRRKRRDLMSPGIG